MSWLAPEPSCVIRGGGWFSVPRNAQVAIRSSTPGDRGDYLGLRLVRRRP